MFFNALTSRLCLNMLILMELNEKEMSVME